MSLVTGYASAAPIDPAQTSAQSVLSASQNQKSK